MRLHNETAWPTQPEPSCRRLAAPNPELIAVEAHVGVQLLIDIALHVQDHPLTDRRLDLLSAWVYVPVGNGDIDGER